MVYITLTHILKGIIEFYHGVYHTHTHPKMYNQPSNYCVHMICNFFFFLIFILKKYKTSLLKAFDFERNLRGRDCMVVRELNIHLLMQSSIPEHGEVYSVIDKTLCDQVC